jgi:hypothetical protein
MDESREPQEFFAAEYAPMSDKELLSIAAEFANLVDPAQAAVREEMKRRGLEMPTPDSPAAPNFYENRSNSDLMKIARGYDVLPEDKKSALREEFMMRGLEPPLVDDGEEDAEQAQPVPDQPDSQLVTVGTYRDLTEAVVSRAVLEQAGIACFLPDENMVRLQWGLSNALGGIRLQVADKDATQAASLLSQPTPASFATDSGADFQQPVCPKCGSLDVMVNDTDRKIGAASAFLAGGLTSILALPVMAAQPKDVWKCRNCGCRWYDDGLPQEDEDAQGAPLR